MLITRKQRGATLIELMVGLIIVSTLFALAANNYSGWIQNQKIRTATESMLNGIQIARSEAVKNNSNASFVLCDALSSWQVLAVSRVSAAPSAADALCGAGVAVANGNEIRVQERSAQEGSRNVQVTATPNGATTITFNSFGRVTTNADGSAIITQLDVTSATGDRPLRVTVGAGGSTRMCDPSALLAANDPRKC